MKSRDPLMFRLGLGATVVALIVVVLGAFVRLTDAGLGCPDWPGCYGQLDVPRTAAQIERANDIFPDRPVDVAKASHEMIHRYVAGVLGLLILALAIVAWRRRHRGVAITLPFSLVGLVVLQSLLGMWTVTLLLKPAIVTAHLIGGMATLALLFLLTLSHMPRFPGMRVTSATRHWGSLAMGVLIVQILLGGWTSTNYAALACPDFPTCQQQWWPEMDVVEGFRPWHGLGIDYEHGVLDSPARTAIHMAHRLWAIVAAIVIGGFAISAMRARQPQPVRPVGATILALLVVQIGLGIGNVVYFLPLWMATAHNGVAALLLLAVAGSLHGMNRRPDPP